jgi:hypothetical protein
MPRFIYVGDPTINPKTGKPHGPCLAGKVSLVDGSSTVTLRAGVPAEVSDVLGKRLAANNHFKATDEPAPPPEPETEASAEVSNDGGESFAPIKKRKR